MEKGLQWNILTATHRDEHANIIQPRISAEKQNRIQQRITEAFTLRKQSKHLLECAKRVVEIAIEQDEQTAVDWLESEIVLFN